MPLTRSFRLLPLLAFVAMLALTGCKTAEEKAEDYYQSALDLMEEGDVGRALVELRNVFKYDGFHKEARQLYAKTQLERGEVAEAYGQYLRLVEQYPDTLSARITLAELAIQRGTWDEAERHGEAAIELAPDDPQVEAISAALDYRTALRDDDAEARAAAADRAEALLQDHPGNAVARKVAVDARLNGEDPQSALPLIEAALEQDPKALDYRMLQARLLVDAGRRDEAEQALEAAYEQFPDNDRIRSTLVSWYRGTGKTDRAEALLRDAAGPDDAPIDGHVALVRFLGETNGDEAARAELERLIGATAGLPQQDLYRALRAGMDFEAGEQDAAIAEMRDILENAEPSDQTRGLKLALARMLYSTGNQVGARELVEEVLAEDPGQVEALKMRASWLIDEDKPDAAIVDLRTALNDAPRDVETILLMADAHERAGSRDLAGERLSMAVEVSNSAPEVALRYADFLLQDGRTQSAEKVLTSARQLHPRNLPVLRKLADLWLKDQDWARLRGLLADLGEMEGDEAKAIAGNLRAAMLLRQNRTEESLAYLDQQFESGNDRALALATMTRLRNGDVEAARKKVEEALAERPDAPGLRMLAATVDAVAGETEAAEKRLRALLEDTPGAEPPVRLLFSLLNSQGRTEEATEVIETGLEAQPGSVPLQLIRGGLYERAGEFDKAIDVYQALYEADSGNEVVANNLASLLADHRDDDETLARAEAIARRLRGQKVPAFQDTYGWIQYRRGDPEAALASLEPAAEALPNLPLAQAHLGLAYAALGRDDEAQPYLSRALELAGDSDFSLRDKVRAARDRIAAGESGDESAVEN